MMRDAPGVRNPETRGCARAVGPVAQHRPMSCPSCGGERIALAAVPGERPGALRVCLDCAALWQGSASDGE
jgi:hypothetical protein